MAFFGINLNTPFMLFNDPVWYRKTQAETGRLSTRAWLLSAIKPIEYPDYMIRNEDQKYTYWKTHYFDDIPLVNPLLLRTPVYGKMIIPFIEELKKDRNEIIEEIDIVLSLASEPEIFKYLTITFLNYFAKNTDTYPYRIAYRHMIEEYYLTGRADWITSEKLEELRNALDN